MRIVFLGPPGSGKGTQASLLAERADLTHISTGVIIRRAMEERTPVGLEAARYVEEGKLVPDEVVRRLAEEALETEDFEDFILDGYPRTVVQARWLDEDLEQHEAALDAVVFLHVSDELIIDRLSKRRVHRVTGENYHLEFKPPPEDVSPDDVIQRADDRPDAIAERLKVYWRETNPVVEYYETSPHFVKIEAVGEIEEVYGRLEQALERIQSRPV